MTRLECIEVEKGIYKRAFDRLLKRMKDSICSPDKTDFKYVLDNEVDFVNLQCCYASLLHHREMVRLHPEYEPFKETLQYFEAAFKAQKERYDAEQSSGIVWIQPALFEGENYANSTERTAETAEHRHNACI